MGGVSVSHVYEMGARVEVTKRELQGDTDNFRMREPGQQKVPPNAFRRTRTSGRNSPPRMPGTLIWRPGDEEKQGLEGRYLWISVSVPHVTVSICPFASLFLSHCTTKETEAQGVKVAYPRSLTRVVMGPDDLLTPASPCARPGSQKVDTSATRVSCIPLPYVLVPSHLFYHLFLGLRAFSTHSSIIHLEENLQPPSQACEGADLGFKDDAGTHLPTDFSPFSN